MTDALLRGPAEEPGDFAELVDLFRDAARHTIETAGPGYLAYVGGRDAADGVQGTAAGGTNSPPVGMGRRYPGGVSQAGCSSEEPAMTGSDITNRVCDRRDCPALAQRAYLIHGQDFYFCTHHAGELERTSPPDTSIARVTVSTVAPVVVVSDLPGVAYAPAPPSAAAEP